MNKAILIAGIAILLMLGFGSFFFVYQAQFLKGRASAITEPFSKENSYVFVTPLRARAGGDERIRLTVFVLNGQGLGVAQKTVSIRDVSGLTPEVVQGTTDHTGKAVIDFSSKNTADYDVSVMVDGQLLPQTVKVSFY